MSAAADRQQGRPVEATSSAPAPRIIARWPRSCAPMSPRRRWAAPRSRASAMSRAASCCPRDRVERLLDPGSPFLEIGQLAACDLYEGEVPGAGMIAGIGRVVGRQVMIVCQRRDGEGRHLLSADRQEASARAGNRARPTACRASIWSTSGGANLPHQAEVFPDRDHFGRIFFNQAQHERRRASPRSPASWAAAPPAGPMSRR